MSSDGVKILLSVPQDLLASIDVVVAASERTRSHVMRQLLADGLANHPAILAHRKSLLATLKADQRAADLAKKQAHRARVAKERADMKAFKDNLKLCDKRSAMLTHNAELKRRYDSAVLRYNQGFGAHPRKPKYLEIPPPTPLCSDYVDEVADIVWDDPE